MMQAGVILSDYATLMIEDSQRHTRPEAGKVYEAIEMDGAKLVGQIAQLTGTKGRADWLRMQDRAPNVPLGQKQTFAVQNVMSALPPIADMCSATRHVR